MVHQIQLQSQLLQVQRGILPTSQVAILRDGIDAVCILALKLPAILLLTELDRAFFGIYSILSIHAMLFAPEYDPDEDLLSPSGGKEPEDERQWEMVRIPDTPGTTGGLKSPITPRTRAFNDLEGSASQGTDLPLREKYAPLVYTGYNAH